MYQMASHHFVRRNKELAIGSNPRCDKGNLTTPDSQILSVMKRYLGCNGHFHAVRGAPGGACKSPNFSFLMIATSQAKTQQRAKGNH